MNAFKNNIGGFFTFQVGRLTLAAVNDGFLQGDLSLVQGISTEQAEDMLKSAYRRNPFRITVNYFAVADEKGKVSLIDSGCGKLETERAQTAGLSAFMQSAELTWDRVSAVYLSHLHFDHFGGIEQDMAFKDSAVPLYISHKELAYWSDFEKTHNRSSMDPTAQRTIDLLHMFKGKIKGFNYGALTDSLEALDLSGHTVGHTGFRVHSEKSDVLIFGDLVHCPAIQLGEPRACMIFDHDQGESYEVRVKTFKALARSKALCAGQHLEFPPVGNLSQHEQYYRFTHSNWVEAN